MVRIVIGFVAQNQDAIKSEHSFNGHFIIESVLFKHLKTHRAILGKVIVTSNQSNDSFLFI